MALRGPTSTRPGYNSTPAVVVKGYEIPTKKVVVTEEKTKAPKKKKGLFGRKK